MIVVAGEALIDLLVPPDGPTTAALGGGPYNTVRTIARLGGSATFLARLSDDQTGQTMRAALAADGVDLGCIEHTDAPTTLAIAELDEDGSAVYRFHTSGTAAPGLSAAAIERAWSARPAAIHLGTLGLVLEPMASNLAAAVTAVGPDPLVMVDPNCRPAAIPDRATYLARLDGIVARADVVKASRDDLAWLAPGGAPMDAATDLLDRGPALVIVTDGPRPIRALGRGFTVEAAVPPVDVVDTVGAGDAFGGAFLARWLELGLGRTGLADADAIQAAVVLAAEVASLTCGRPGADPPRRAETHWPARPSRP